MKGLPRGLALHWIGIPSLLLSAFILYGYPGIALWFNTPDGTTSPVTKVDKVNQGSIGRLLTSDTSTEKEENHHGNNTNEGPILQVIVQNLPVAQNPQEPEDNLQADVSQKPVKVILFTYMRSGSTLLGELFNQNKDVFYLFEPLAAIYPHLFGIGYLNKAQPIDIFFHANGTRRMFSSLEVDTILKFYEDVFDCSTDQLPLYSRVAPFLFLFNHIKLKESYLPCLNRVLPKPVNKSTKKLSYQQMLSRCHSLLPGCSPFPYNQDHEVCKTHIVSRENHPKYAKSKFDKFGLCLDDIEALASKCGKELKNDCENSKIFVMKTIRMDMHLVGHMLDNDPNIKIIYSTRDPRGIINSRISTSTISRLSKHDPIPEAKYMCAKMMEDLDIMEELQQHYPDTFLQIKYEDMVKDGQGSLDKLYAHIQIPVTKEIQNWMYTHMHASRDKDIYGTSRKNSTETANKWKSSLKKSFIRQITRTCWDLLKRLDYSVDYSV